MEWTQENKNVLLLRIGLNSFSSPVSLRQGTWIVSDKIEVHKCPGARQTNYLVKLSYPLEDEESDLMRFCVAMNFFFPLK